MTEREKIKHLFSDLDMVEIKFYKGTISKKEKDIEECNKYNESLANRIKEIKINVLKYGINYPAEQLKRCNQLCEIKK